MRPGARARKAGRFDYDAKVAGLEVPDRYTLRIHLKEIDYGLSHDPRVRSQRRRGA